MIHYIMNTIAFQLFFLIIYDLFLKKETFFNWNRVYLLVTSVLSLIIPFIKINRFKEILPQDFIISLPEVIIGSTTKSQTDINTLQLDPVIVTSKSIWSWELILYAGMLLATLLFLFKIIKLTLLFFKNPKSRIGDLHIVSLLNSNAAFSCFNCIFLGERINEIAKASIIKHEMAHVKEKHTLDLLFFEVLRILFWFNPLVYMYQNRIMQLHEFLADKKALEYQSKIDYYENLLAQVFQTENISFINPFFKQSLIKKRIVMLQKSKSKQINLLKYTLLIPMVLVMLVYTSTEAQNANNNVLSASETELIPLREINMEVPFSEVDETPIFPGCEDLDKNEQKTCFTNKVTKHIVKNFNTHKAIQLGFIGRQRIHVIFKINKDGNVTGVRSRAAHSELEKEAIDLIRTLPKMIPGKQNGENVTVTYSLPIILQIQDKSTVDEMVVVAYEENSSKNEPNVSKKNVPFTVVDQAPIFPGCESLSNEEQKACMSKNMASHVNKNFNTKLAEDLGLVGRQRINIIFKINTEGDIEGVRCKAPHPELEKEAIRVINTLPKMIPGKHEGKVVNVPYSLPIIFQVQDKTNMLDEIAIVGYRGYSKDEIPFTDVEETPSHTDCKDLADNLEKRKCVSNMIQKHINRNFNVSKAKSLGVKGRQRIDAIFKINTEGHVVDISSKASHPGLEEETNNVIKTLPQFIPGKHKGKAVTVVCSLPITLQIRQ
ncbi:M56 family metallopeptidase [Flavivirga aquimarina]|uniref:M56 family metallopeptidase n=1 Tax=Flavivirga aquimarina TaxID=2027862 RepID=A0ABT8W637_9FLAO|nr:M56 family metallopeptidase [Flavivirga aquimarina]MDO5968579.1 M56 family metallopeptidase [Flavivirga aquimarina]